MVPIQIIGDSSPSLQARIEKKFSKLEKFHKNIESLRIHLMVNKEEHKASALVKAEGEFFAEATSDDMYKTIDLLAEKIIKQFSKYQLV